MKKIFFSLAVFTVFILVGCGGGGVSASGSTTPSNAIPAGGNVNVPANTH